MTPLVTLALLVGCWTLSIAIGVQFINHDVGTEPGEDEEDDR